MVFVRYGLCMENIQNPINNSVMLIWHQCAKVISLNDHIIRDGDDPSIYNNNTTRIRIWMWIIVQAQYPSNKKSLLLEKII